MKRCQHEWTYVEGGPYNADEDAACYRDGFNYVPPGSTYRCTKCGKTKPAGDNVFDGDWKSLVLFPFILVGLILWVVLFPVALLINAIYESLPSHKAASGLGQEAR